VLRELPPLAVYSPPDQVDNDWNDLAIGVCTGPVRVPEDADTVTDPC